MYLVSFHSDNLDYILDIVVMVIGTVVIFGMPFVAGQRGVMVYSHSM